MPWKNLQRKTSDLLYSLSLIAIIELLLFYLPSVFLIILFSLFLIRTNNHTVLTYVSLTIISVYFIISLSFDSNTMKIYNTQENTEIKNESIVYLVFFSMIFMYYVFLFIYGYTHKKTILNLLSNYYNSIKLLLS